MKILVVEDDTQINSFICRGLRESGFSTESATDGETGLDLIWNDSSIDLVVLDLMLPKINGIELLTRVRKNGNRLPIIILSAKKSVDEKIEGLQHGADDYLVKPFAFSELLARIQALFRRNRPLLDSTSLTQFGITLDLMTRKVTRDGKNIELQVKEFLLLEYFLKNPERVISKTMILETIYGYDFDPRTNVVDVLVCRLRNKIDKEFGKKSIHTLRGMGYVLKEE
jgi:DNA-binding response OmpR family regulator